jgi:hypothetical protein
MNLEPIMPWLAAFLSVAAVLGQLKAFFSSGEKQLDDRLDKAETKLIDLDRRTQACEAELKHAPDKDTVTDLKIAMAELRGVVATLGETVGSVSRTVHRIDDFLREGGKT